jgi:adenylate cyclase
VEAAEEVGFRLVTMRGRVLLARALARAGERDAAARELQQVAEAADRAAARMIRVEAEAAAGALGMELTPVEAEADVVRSKIVPLGERLVTSLFADVRGYSALSASEPPAELAERMGALFRFARLTLERHGGIVDKFAGDAIMATFNVSGARVDHCEQALEAAFTLRDRAALMDLSLGIGIAVGPAVLAKGSSGENLSVSGVATNLASRLQAIAGRSEVLVSEDVHRRVRGWLAERRVAAEREELQLKGFDDHQVAYRIRAPEGEPSVSSSPAQPSGA